MRSLCVFLLLTSLMIIAPEPPARTAQDSGSVSVGQALQNAVKQSRLTESGSAPFHLKATSAPAFPYSADLRAEIEEYWVSPDRWKRTIRSKDFEQTVIVNGSSRFEQDSSDYYPKWLNDIVTALFDVVPRQTIEEVSELRGQIPLPDGKPGAWSVKYSPGATDGKVTVTWSASVNFERKKGLLTWVSATGFAADFKEYKTFHGKEVSRLIETFPLEPHGDVKTRVTELSDWDAPDDPMFAVPQPTPPEQQVRLVRVPEVEYRQMAIDPPEMKWPPVKARPTSGGLTTYIVTDRTGKVRECKFIISNNMTLAQGAVELVKQWHFKPLVIDGVPVEVETTLTFPYETQIEGEQAKFQPASFYFKQARDLTYPRTEGSPPFHLKGTFQGSGVFSGLQGIYEETWNAPNRWRRQIAIGNTTVIESRIDDDHYFKQPDPRLAPVVDRVFSLFGAEFPGFAYYSPDTDWYIEEVEFERAPVLRVAMIHKDDQGKPVVGRGYFFDENGLLRARTIASGTITIDQNGRIRAGINAPEAITYDEFLAFGGKQVPRRIFSKFSDALALTAHIDVLEPAQPMPDEFFVLSKVKPTDWVRPSPW